MEMKLPMKGIGKYESFCKRRNRKSGNACISIKRLLRCARCLKQLSRPINERDEMINGIDKNI